MHLPLRLSLIAATLPLLALLTSCATGIPKGVQPVQDFDADRYLGTWYEIARLDHSFERGLNNVTATYSRRPDGSIRVINRGYEPARDRWKEARGVARFRGDDTVASLRVSFFWPFQGGYHVAALDDDYQWALITGPSRSYLWILARTPHLDPAIIDRLVETARDLDFPTGELIFVEHDRDDPGASI